jgi:hypothetical protein
MNFSKIFQSKILAISLGIILAIVALLLAFKLGTVVGFHKADFSFKWGENYHRNFAGPKEGFFKNLDDRNFMPAHGVFGKIIKIDVGSLIIQGQDNIEKSIYLSNKTIIERFRETIKPQDLKIDDRVVIIGAPSSTGQIEAQFIRIMPPPPNL